MKEKIKILVADDEGEMRQLLGMILKSNGYTDIIYAVDGPNAIQTVTQREIQVAFVDIDMPGEDGFSVIKQAMEIRPSCFCVMVTGQSAMENVRNALGAGARGFIVKPYAEQKILDMLAKFNAVKDVRPTA